MRRLLAIATATAAIGAIGAIPGTASARYIGTFVHPWDESQLMSGPEYIAEGDALDANVACSWSAGNPPENNRYMNPCKYSGAQHGVCINASTIYGQPYSEWKCGWEVESMWVGNYGYTAIWCWLPYEDVAVYMIDNYG
jgi:hypothetical protein